MSAESGGWTVRRTDVGLELSGDGYGRAPRSPPWPRWPGNGHSAPDVMAASASAATTLQLLGIAG